MNGPRLECSGKVWSCYPKDWKSFSSSCYFISTDAKSWNESQENCSRMEAHLVVINSKEEQDFIILNLQTDAVYYVGLSDLEGQRHWQWVDGTPYNPSATTMVTSLRYIRKPYALTVFWQQDLWMHKLKRTSGIFFGRMFKALRFWHLGEPSHSQEQSVTLTFRSSTRWGWNDFRALAAFFSQLHALPSQGLPEGIQLCYALPGLTGPPLKSQWKPP
ncbi:C-type lectin domain family 4 member A-like [Sciurus carolinensis]|uniref:C-type lectin domain family 4 member A-like n=1 Tax=Sciurus carolinensis TaxID=30640 RepID=UPI001FB2B1EC|nr:C-type lectin domain family 4 member A-like [Sciurus carolinensis]